MWIPAAVGMTATAGLAAGVYVQRKRARRRADAQAAAAAQAAAQPVVEEVGQPQGSAPLNLSSTVNNLKGLGAGGALGTIGAGLAAADLAGRAVEAAGGGKGKADVVRTLGPAALLPTLVDVGVERALDAVGVDDVGVKKGAGQLGAAAAVGGLPGIVAVGGVKLVDAGLGLISKDAQETVHDVFRPLDPTNPNSAVGKAVGGVGDAVSGGVGGVVKAVGNIFASGPSPEELAQREAARKAAEAALQAGTVKVEQVAQAVQAGGFGGLLNAGKALAGQAQLPVFAPAVVPIQPPPPPAVPVSSPPAKLPGLKLPGSTVNLIKFGGGEL